MSPENPLFGRRRTLAGAAAAALGLALVPAVATPAGAATRRPFGPYGSPRRRRDERTLYVDPRGRGDHTTVQAAVNATPDAPERGWTLVIAAGTYRETVLVPQVKTGLTFLGATRDARDVVIVFDNAAG
ncbi:pectinesterase family protein, partial [Streptosporangium sp. G12]